jgi:exodeoxyribonuclease VII large subunit
MSRWAFERLDPRPVEGQSVQVHGRVTLYDKRAELSLRADRIEPAGDGALLARIEEARRRLDADGLFDAARKRRPPLWPQGIGLIAGHDAAAPLDIIRNARARLPSARFVLAETAVQGDRAVPEILRALAALEARPDVDVIVISRGGGSLEDLLPFSDEQLCRAIAACATVVVSAVGHERDVPLCDLVADVRASTPTDAARLIVPDARQELENVERLRSSARRCAERVIARARERLEALASRPALRSADYWVVSRREAIGRLRAVLDGAPQRALTVRGERADQLVARLRAVAPQATLERGYAIVIDDQNQAVRDGGALLPGERVELRLARGGAGARIEEVRADG